MLLDVALVLHQLVAQELFEMCSYALEPRHSVNHIARQMVAINFIEHGHVEGRGRRPLFLVAAHVEAIVIVPAIGEPVNQPRITVVRKENGLVGGEHRIKIAVGKAVRML